MSERRGEAFEFHGLRLAPIEEVETHRILGWYRTQRRCVALLVLEASGERRVDLPR